MPVNSLRFFAGELVAFPQFILRGGFAQKKNFAMLLLIGVRIEQQDGLLLFDAGQVEQIRVGAHRQCAVGVGRENVVGIDDDQRVGKQ